jgi:hypothetical protein
VTNLTICVGDPIFEFTSYINWVNKAQSWYSTCGVPARRLLTVDSLGRVCTQGSDFIRADREQAFPIRVFPIDINGG